MKKLKLAILFAMSAAGAMAQNFEGSSVEDRIAHSTGKEAPERQYLYTYAACARSTP